MTAFKRFDEPVEVDRNIIKARYDALGPTFKGRSAKIGKALEAADYSKVVDGSIMIEVDGDQMTLDDKYFEVMNVKEKVSGKRIIPHMSSNLLMVWTVFSIPVLSTRTASPLKAMWPCA